MKSSSVKVSIILAEDHCLVRQGVRALLSFAADFSIVGETGDGREAVQLVERLCPDVLVLDLMLPGLNGLEVARRVHRRSPQTRVVILTLHASELYVQAAFKNGAAGYVLKDSTATDLIDAIRAALDGRRYLSQPLSDQPVTNI